MTLRRHYHLLVYRPGEDKPASLVHHPLYRYPNLEAARAAAREFACKYDHGIVVDVLDDSEVVERVRSCQD